MSIGEQLQINGVAANLAAATAATRDFRDHAETILAAFSRQRREFTADDVREAIPPEADPPHSPNTLPSLINAWSRRGAIEPVGWVRSTRRTRHASVNRVWRGTGCAVD